MQLVRYVFINGQITCYLIKVCLVCSYLLLQRQFAYLGHCASDLSQTVKTSKSLNLE